VLNPVLGKSVVVYSRKPGSPGAARSRRSTPEAERVSV